MNKYKDYFLSLNPQDNEILKIGCGEPFDVLEKIIATLGEPTGEHMYLVYSYDLHELRGQTKEAEALKPVIEKEIDPDFFKPKRTCIL